MMATRSWFSAVLAISMAGPWTNRGISLTGRKLSSRKNLPLEGPNVCRYFLVSRFVGDEAKTEARNSLSCDVRCFSLREMEV